MKTKITTIDVVYETMYDTKLWSTNINGGYPEEAGSTDQLGKLEMLRQKVNELIDEVNRLVEK